MPLRSWLRWPGGRDAQSAPATPPAPGAVRCDIHSHITPGIDDGADSIETALAMVRGLADLGYQAAVTTPHVHQDLFPNREPDLLAAFDDLAAAAAETSPGFKLGLAAEYMLDEVLLGRLYDAPGDLLRLGPDRDHLLMELPTVVQPMFLDECLDEARRQGLIVILAHVERYTYVQAEGGLARVHAWRERGVRAQVNVASFDGVYGSKVRRAARDLWRRGMVDILGSDLHRPSQLDAVARGWRWLAKKPSAGFLPTRQASLAPG